MKNKVYFLGIAAVLTLFLINSVYAELMISQPKSLYNIGDELKLDISINEQTKKNDFLTVKIVCDNGAVELYKGPLSVNAGESKIVPITANLDLSLIGAIEGFCHIESFYADKNAMTQDFEITKRIIVSLASSNWVFNPGEKITFSGTAKKANGQDVSGFADITLEGTSISIVTDVNAGLFNATLIIPGDSAAGSFPLNVNVYEKESSGEQTNFGVYSSAAKIKQIPKKVEVALSSSSVNPSEDVSFTVNLYDQANSPFVTNVNLEIYSSDNSLFLKKLVKSSESSLLDLPSNAQPGFWKIKSSFDSLSAERTFEIKEAESVSYSFEDGVLIVENTGNVPYEKMVEIKVGDNNIFKKLDVPVSGIKRFLVKAKEGDYNILVDDLGKKYDLGSKHIFESSGIKIPLITGAAVTLKEVDSLQNAKNINILIWIVIILILLALFVYYYRKMGRKNIASQAGQYYSLKTNKSYETENKSAKLKREVKSQPQMKQMFQTYDPSEEKSQDNSSISDKEAGNREEAIVLSLKIKNSSKLNSSESSAFLAVNNALHKAKLAKGRVYEQGDFRIIVFSPSTTPNIDHAEAIKIACDIDSKLKEFNKKYAIKIDYGIGANSGDMLFEVVNGKPKFTSVGNTVVLSKNAAERANNEVLVSQQLYRKVYNVVKSEPTQSGLYKILSFKDRSSQSPFIQRFMKK